MTQKKCECSPSKASFKTCVSALCCGNDVQDLFLSFEYCKENIVWVVSDVNVGLDMTNGYGFFCFDVCGWMDLNLTGIWVKD